MKKTIIWITGMILLVSFVFAYSPGDPCWWTSAEESHTSEDFNYSTIIDGECCSQKNKDTYETRFTCTWRKECCGPEAVCNIHNNPLCQENTACLALNTGIRCVQIGDPVLIKSEVIKPMGPDSLLCPIGEYCTSGCKCEADGEGQGFCGDGTLQGNEECETSQDCEDLGLLGYTCDSECNCVSAEGENNPPDINGNNLGPIYGDSTQGFRIYDSPATPDKDQKYKAFLSGFSNINNAKDKIEVSDDYSSSLTYYVGSVSGLNYKPNPPVLEKDLPKEDSFNLKAEDDGTTSIGSIEEKKSDEQTVNCVLCPKGLVDLKVNAFKIKIEKKGKIANLDVGTYKKYTVSRTTIGADLGEDEICGFPIFEYKNTIVPAYQAAWVFLMKIYDGFTAIADILDIRKNGEKIYVLDIMCVPGPEICQSHEFGESYDYWKEKHWAVKKANWNLKDNGASAIITINSVGEDIPVQSKSKVFPLGNHYFFKRENHPKNNKIYVNFRTYGNLGTKNNIEKIADIIQIGNNYQIIINIDNKDKDYNTIMAYFRKYGKDWADVDLKRTVPVFYGARGEENILIMNTYSDGTIEIKNGKSSQTTGRIKINLKQALKLFDYAILPKESLIQKVKKGIDAVITNFPEEEKANYDETVKKIKDLINKCCPDADKEDLKQLGLDLNYDTQTNIVDIGVIAQIGNVQETFVNIRGWTVV